MTCVYWSAMLQHRRALFVQSLVISISIVWNKPSVGYKTKCETWDVKSKVFHHSITPLIHHSITPIIHRPNFPSPFTFDYLPSLFPSSIFHLPSSIFYLPSSIIHLLSSIFCLLSSIFYLLSSIFYLLSSIFYLPSPIFTILPRSLSAIRYSPPGWL